MLMKAVSLLHPFISNLLSWEPSVQCTQCEDGDYVDIDEDDMDDVDDIACHNIATGKTSQAIAH